METNKDIALFVISELYIFRTFKVYTLIYIIYFIKSKRLNVYYYSSIKDQIDMLFKKKVLPVKIYESKNDNLICDIKDGSYYKDFISSIKKENNDSNVFSFMLNTDGISLCEKSNLAIWPVYLAINELPIEERFHIDNII